MPVVEKAAMGTPRSALRYRPIATNTTGVSGKRAATTPVPSPTIVRASRPHPHQADNGLEIKEWLRVDDSESPYSAASTWTRQATYSLPKLPQTRPELASSGIKRFKQQQLALYRQSPHLYLGLGMLIAMILWALIMGIAGWANTTLNDLRYGRPRTSQIDQVVGHNDSPQNPSHFIVINLHRHIEIIEIAGEDPGHSKIYQGPQLFGSGDDLIPATLSFADVNGDHRPDMILHIQAAQVVYINDGRAFRPMRADERARIEQFLLDHPQDP